jgi:DNA-binding transcriptional MerR regulator
MKIGELSERTGVATRLLRYYEEQGLLEPERSSNGYRTYASDSVERVERVRGLIQSGLPTRLIRILLDMEGVRGSELAESCTREVAEVLRSELSGIEDRIACLSRSRETMRSWLATVRVGEPAPAHTLTQHAGG